MVQHFFTRQRQHNSQQYDLRSRDSHLDFRRPPYWVLPARKPIRAAKARNFSSVRFKKGWTLSMGGQVDTRPLSTLGGQAENIFHGYKTSSHGRTYRVLASYKASALRSKPTYPQRRTNKPNRRQLYSLRNGDADPRR